jgi:hypothetical protein
MESGTSGRSAKKKAALATQKLAVRLKPKLHRAIFESQAARDHISRKAMREANLEEFIASATFKAVATLCSSKGVKYTELILGPYTKNIRRSEASFTGHSCDPVPPAIWVMFTPEYTP